MNNCLFCQIANKQTPAHILYENDVVIGFLSLENHPLIVPKKHFPDLSDLEDKYAEEIMKAAVVVSKAMRAATGCEGINLIQYPLLGLNPPSFRRDRFSAKNRL